MNNMDYLNQISADTRPAKKSASLFSSLPISGKLIKFILIGLAAFVLIIVISAILKNRKDPEQDLFTRINIRTSNLSDVIDDHNSDLKSTRLRAIGNNIASVLSYTESKTEEFIESYYGAEDKKGNKNSPSPNQAIIDEEDAYLEEIEADLEDARIEGHFDRTYHRTLTREIGYLLALEAELLNRTKKSDVIDTLIEPYNNLGTLYEEISNFTDPYL